ncbi:MAG: hypothetical protein WKF96_04925 [Solirubrobacteraceae bacterium]
MPRLPAAITVLADDPTIDRAVPAGAAPEAPQDAPRAARHGLRLLVSGALALAALSLLAPSSPTYDPWAWIVWGREIAHLDLVTTTGPSWKPLPVLFTTVFSVFGEAAPSLWLVVARAGAIAAVAIAYLLGRVLGAGRLGAAVAAIALATAPWWTVNGWLGNSEGLLVACVLGACLAHLHGHRRLAFALAVTAGLLRPEAWPFLGLYGLWLFWRQREERAVVAAGLLLLPLLWLVPEQLGSGDLLRASSRAQTDLSPGAAGRADEPALEILRDFWALLPLGVWVGVFVAVGVAIAARRHRRVPWPVIALAVLAATWVGIVAFMASRGYSGNQRYLVAPGAIVLVLAGVGAAAVLRVLPKILQPPVALGVLAAFALTGTLDSIDAVPETRSQSRLAGDLEGAVERAGGTRRLRSCGPLVTEPLLIPQVAWLFGVHLQEVFDASTPGPDAAVMRAQVSPQLRPYPPASLYEGLPQRQLAEAPRWEIAVVGRCAG